MRKGNAALLALCLGMPLMASAAGKFTAADYKRALWMATRFYGGQRSGAGPNWLLIGLPDSLQKSFTHDSYGGKDVAGGWFDCGDHVMFGQTQYWAAYSLAKAYEAFPQGFDDLYNGVDYSDYVSSGKWNDPSGGTPNGIPDIIDELVYEADYIAKAAISSTEFISLKGDGTKDHNRWVTAGMMSMMSQNNGGECASGGDEKYDGPNWTFVGHLTPCTSYASRQVKADPDRTMSSYGAATLAVMSRLLTRLNIYPERAKLYAEKAKLAYQAAAGTSASVAYTPFYDVNKHSEDDYVVASTEMYLLTGDATYKTNANAYLGKVDPNHNWAFCYSNNDDIAYYDAATILSDASSRSGLMKYADYYKSKENSDGVSAVGDAGWGSLRYPLAGAYVMALANSVAGTAKYDDDVYKQVDFVMGGNSSNQSFITGFRKDANYKMPQHPHHRGYYQRNDNPEDSKKSSMTPPEKNQSHGSLVGNIGFASSGFQDDVLQYKYTEVCTDYNVGLVGALGYIVSKLAPADTNAFFHKGSSGVPEVAGHSTRISFSQVQGRVEVRMAGMALVSGEAYDLSGRRVAALVARETGLSLSTMGLKSGLYLVRVRTAEGQSLSHSVMVY